MLSSLCLLNGPTFDGFHSGHESTFSNNFEDKELIKVDINVSLIDMWLLI